MTVPIIPRVFDILHPRNESRSYTYIFEAEYTINREQYYTLIFLHNYVVGMIAITSIITVDATYAVYANHACGMFVIVRYH